MAADAPLAPLSDEEVAEGLRAIHTRPSGLLYWSVYALFTCAYVWLARIEWGGVLGWIWITAAALLAVLPFLAPPIRSWRFARMSATARRDLYGKRLKQTIYWDAPPILLLGMGAVMAVMFAIDDTGKPPMAVILPGMCFLVALQMQRTRLHGARHREHLARLEGAPPQGAPERATA